MDANQTLSPLAEHLNVTLYKPWRENRKPLEKKWLDNWEAFRGIVTGTWKACEGSSYRSDTNINYTRQKVMAAFSIIVQQVIRAGHIAFGVRPDIGNPWMKQLLGPDALQRMEEDAQSMHEMIDADLARCDAEKAYARNVLSSVVYGETYAKEVTAMYQTTRHRPVLPEGIAVAPEMDPGMLAWESYREEAPGFSWVYVPVWEIVRDMETDDLQAGTGFFHERPVSPYFLRGKKGQPGWDDDAIDRVIKAASVKTGTDGDKDGSMLPGLQRLQSRQNSIRYREYHGRVPTVLADTYEASVARVPGAEGEGGTVAPAAPAAPKDEDLKSGDEVEVIVVLADDYVVFFERNTGFKRPLERAVLEDALDDIGGNGVADNTRDVHKAMTGAFRAYEDGAKAASALILVLREALVSNPEDISRGIQSGFATIVLEAGPHSLKDAVQQLQLSNPAANIEGLLQLLSRFIDEESMVPKISAGISTREDQATTAYEYSQRVERAGTYIGMVIRNHDEGLTEPMVQRVVDRYQRDPDFPGPRGDFAVEAQGFAGYETRTVRVAAIYKLLEIAMGDPDIKRRMKLDPVLTEIAASLDMSSAEFFRSDTEMQEQDERIQAMAQAEAMSAENAEAARARKDNAQADKTTADIGFEAERLKIDRAEAVAGIEKGLREPAKPPAKGKGAAKAAA